MTHLPPYRINYTCGSVSLNTGSICIDVDRYGTQVRVWRNRTQTMGRLVLVFQIPDQSLSDDERIEYGARILAHVCRHKFLPRIALGRSHRSRRG